MLPKQEGQSIHGSEVNPHKHTGSLARNRKRNRRRGKCTQNLEKKGQRVFKKRTSDAENCLDFKIITKGLETRTRNYKLEVDREWTPARAVPTGKGIGPGKENTRGQASDHKAQHFRLLLDTVEKGNKGNLAIINYNNRQGWLLYKTPQIFQRDHGNNTQI